MLFFGVKAIGALVCLRKVNNAFVRNLFAHKILLSTPFKKLKPI
jgi:hypothetical protein